MIVADTRGDLAALERKLGASDEDTSLFPRAKVHLGDVVTCFTGGPLMTLENWLSESDTNLITPVFYGCVLSRVFSIIFHKLCHAGFWGLGLHHVCG